MSVQSVSSKNLYQYNDASPYDENFPEFNFFRPLYSGEFWIVDCEILNANGDTHPEYNGRGVPIYVDDIELFVPKCPRERIIEHATESLSWEIIGRELVAQMSKRDAEEFVDWIEKNMIDKPR